MIEIKNVFKSYNKPVLNNLNFSIKEGSIFGLIGINGAGKSTLINMLSGTMKPTMGQVLYDGEDVYDNEKVKSEIFYLPDEPYYERNTTPESILKTYNVFYKIDEEKFYSYLKLFNLPIKEAMFNFSKGMKRQVFVALALAIKPKYLYLDEAFDGLDPLARMALKKILLEVQDENNMTVVISSHSLRELEDICDSYGLLDKGTMATYGELAESRQKYHKYTLAFEEEYDEKEFMGINFIAFKKEKRVITCVTNLDYEQMKEAIKDKNPLLIEEYEVDFEELFMIEVQSRGYLK